MAVPVISVNNFSMKFGNTTVIDDLSFEVFSGDVFGLLGSNGSGKTTTIRTLLGIYRPHKGTLLVNGQAYSPSLGYSLGYLPEERGLYKKESVIDIMTYFGQLKNLSRVEARQWSLSYLDRVDLADKASSRLDQLSGGQQQKIQLGVTIMNNPSLLILDEPTKGFDPVNRRLMLDIVEERRREGATVVLVTHQMEEVERLCNRIILLKDGKRRLYGRTDEVKAEFSENLIRLHFSGKLTEKNKVFTIAKQTDSEATLVPQGNVTPHEVLTELIKQPKITISQFMVEQPSLDDIFVQIYNEDR